MRGDYIGFDSSRFSPDKGEALFLSKNAPRTAAAFKKKTSCASGETDYIFQTALVEIGPVAFVEAFLSVDDVASAKHALGLCLTLTEDEQQALQNRLVDLYLSQPEKYFWDIDYLGFVQGERKDKVVDALLEAFQTHYPNAGWGMLDGLFGRTDHTPGKLSPEQERRFLTVVADRIVAGKTDYPEDDAFSMIAANRTPEDLRRRLINWTVFNNKAVTAMGLFSERVHYHGRGDNLQVADKDILLQVVEKEPWWKRLGFVLEISTRTRLPWSKRLAVLFKPLFPRRSLLAN